MDIHPVPQDTKPNDPPMTTNEIGGGQDMVEMMVDTTQPITEEELCNHDASGQTKVVMDMLMAQIREEIKQKVTMTVDTMTKSLTKTVDASYSRTCGLQGK